jgi:hypothetical protein
MNANSLAMLMLSSALGQSRGLRLRAVSAPPVHHVSSGPRAPPPLADVAGERVAGVVDADAFCGTMWSVLLQLNEGGNTIFTLQCFEDGKCRFSDTEELGSWEGESGMVAFEKPKALFDDTLYFSARLEQPAAEGQPWRLVDGVIGRSVAASGGEADGAIELVEIGSFGANELDEASMARGPPLPA